MNDALIVGTGIGGLTLALEFHRRNIACRIFESAPEIKPVGVGINLLPHATEVLGGLGLLAALEKVGVETQEAVFFNRFGQLIYKEALGRRAGSRRNGSGPRPPWCWRTVATRPTRSCARSTSAPATSPSSASRR